MFVLERLATLVLTILLAPAFAYVAMATLQADTFDPGATLSGLAHWYEALLLHGDLGYNEYYDQPLTELIRDGLPADMTMLGGALAFGLVAGAVGGLVAVARPRSAATRVMDVLAGLGVSLPVYWMGFVVLMLFANNSGMIVQLSFVSGQADYESLPADPLQFVQSLWLPAVVAGTPIAAGVYRMTIATSREALGEDFIRTARAKGLSTRRVLTRHVLPVSAIPVAMLAAAQVNLALTNIALLQVGFNIPGSFRELGRALANGNLMLVQALVLYGCTLVALANTAADLLQARLDPRVRR